MRPARVEAVTLAAWVLLWVLICVALGLRP